MRQIVGLHEYSDWSDPYNSRTQAVKYMVSHDEQSILQEMVTFNSYSIEEARSRDKFYATILFYPIGFLIYSLNCNECKIALNKHAI